MLRYTLQLDHASPGLMHTARPHRRPRGRGAWRKVCMARPERYTCRNMCVIDP